MITTLLIANRGEIACRIIRTCQRLGIRAVAVYSTPDADAPHVQQADSAYWIGPAAASDSYLNQQKILEIAQQSGAQAIHPGYGFLAENATFAQACTKAGLLFIGPSATVIELMGNKRIAKQTVEHVGVPTVPGSPLETMLDDQALLQAANEIGFPLMIKAAAGGGGLGMRLIHTSSDLAAALPGARRDAQAAFSSAEVLLERAIINPRHIEVQIFGDSHGNIVHLGERECSIQRRHQKIIEEAPAANLDPATRDKLHQYAIAVAQTIQYTNAGTVEFLLDSSNDIYFLEVNTRLQVEHPVTEAITGYDLVEWQIHVAEGRALPVQQDEISFNGHAIEARLYAEDVENNFQPVSGTIQVWQPHPALRIESGINQGSIVSVYYDPMIAKLIAWAPERTTAARQLAYGLEHSPILGCITNRDFLARILRHPAFLAGELATNYLEQHAEELNPPADRMAQAIMIATCLTWHQQSATTGWRNNAYLPTTYSYSIHNQPIQVAWTAARGTKPHSLCYQYAEQTYEFPIESIHITGHTIQIVSRGIRQHAAWAKTANQWWIDLGSQIIHIEAQARLPQPRTHADAGGSLRAPMPGTILDILVEPGQHVAKGTALLTLEAMKMEHTLRTNTTGTVTSIYYTTGDTVEADTVLIAIKEDN